MRSGIAWYLHMNARIPSAMSRREAIGAALLACLGARFTRAAGTNDSSALPALINAVLAKTQYHDLNGLVAALQKGGLDAQVKSWLGPGANLPITEEQLKAVLGNAQVQDFARHLGLPVDQALKTMAQYLPEIVDKASPDGVLKTT